MRNYLAGIAAAAVLLASLAVASAVVPAIQRLLEVSRTPDEATAEPDPCAAPLDNPSSVVPGQTPLRDCALEELAPLAPGVFRRQTGALGVAVILPSYGRIYTRNGDEPFPMASVVKVVIMAAAIDGAAEEGRPITIGERDLLEPMITWSDNDSAEVLWRRLGGAKGIDAFLRQKGISGMQMDSYGYWGDSLATPRAVAELMALLVWGDLLAEPGRSYALRLLESVLPSQRWGVTEARAEPSPDEVVGGKNGWYPEDGGWAVNSVGYVVPTTGQNGYAIAILSSRQEDFDGAVANTQALAGMVHQALRRASSTATSVATPAAQD